MTAGPDSPDGPLRVYQPDDGRGRLKPMTMASLT